MSSNHLGTSSFVTDGDGDPTQFYLNFPFGETLYEQQNTNAYENPYKFNAKELDDETGLYYYGARYYDPRIGMWLSVDPLAEKFPAWSPYHYAFDNPVRFVDLDGREGTDWIRKGNKFIWDDRVINQETADKYHKGSEYIGKNARIHSIHRGTGETLSTISLNSDGTATRNGYTINQYSAVKSFTNEAGQEIIPRKTEGYNVGISANFAFLGGFGIEVGKVYDSVGDSSWYFTFNGNLGLGMGIDLVGGMVTPNDNIQFLVGDFAGKSASYNYGISMPGYGIGQSYGGSINTGYNSNATYFTPDNWSKNDRGHKINQINMSRGGGWGAGAMWTYGQTKLMK